MVLAGYVPREPYGWPFRSRAAASSEVVVTAGLMRSREELDAESLASMAGTARPDPDPGLPDLWPRNGPPGRGAGDIDLRGAKDRDGPDSNQAFPEGSSFVGERGIRGTRSPSSRHQRDLDHDRGLPRDVAESGVFAGRNRLDPCQERGPHDVDE